MARRRLEIGDHGEISTKQLADGRHQARCRYRTPAGTTVQRKAIGKSAEAARRNLKAALKRETAAPGYGDQIQRGTNVTKLCAAWLDSNHDIGDATRIHYQRAIDQIIAPAIGDRLITEVRAGDLQRVLDSIESTTYRKWARTVLRGSFQSAVIDGALTVNPARETNSGPKKRGHEIDVLDVEDVARLRANIVEWQAAQKYGPARGSDLLEIVDVALGTGARFGEILALRHEDLALDATPPIIMIRGTIVSHTGKPERQTWGKTKGSTRSIPAPAFAVDAIRRQLERDVAHLGELVFPDRNGNPRNPNNVRRSLRAARGDVDTDFRKLRRTVATLTADTVGLQEASRLLGHSRLSTTETHYAAKPAMTPDVTAILDNAFRAQSVPETEKKAQASED